MKEMQKAEWPHVPEQTAQKIPVGLVLEFAEREKKTKSFVRSLEERVPAD
jgi:hypothetical protein